MKFLLCILLIQLCFASITDARKILRNSKPFRHSSVCRNNNIPYCGTYVANCEDDGDISALYTEKIDGRIYSLPTHLQESRFSYKGGDCSDEKHVMGVINGFALKPDENLPHYFTATMDSAQAIIWDLSVMEGFTCKDPFPVGKVVNVMDTDCKDPSGDDFFDDAKASLGKVFPLELEWNDEGLIDGTEVHKRVSDEGCTTMK